MKKTIDTARLIGTIFYALNAGVSLVRNLRDIAKELAEEQKVDHADVLRRAAKTGKST
jgi:hypothetical protein